jgi:hypothetical protein
VMMEFVKLQTCRGGLHCTSTSVFVSCGTKTDAEEDACKRL